MKSLVIPGCYFKESQAIVQWVAAYEHQESRF